MLRGCSQWGIPVDRICFLKLSFVCFACEYRYYIVLQVCDTQLAGEYRINCISLLILSISMWTLGSFPCVHILEATQESEVVREISLGMRQTHWVCRLCQCTEGTDYFHVDIGFLSPCVQPAVTQLSTVTQPIIFFLRRLSLSQDDIMCIKLK